MSISFDVTGTSKDVQQDLNIKVPSIVRAARITAMNKTVDKVFTQVKRAIKSETGVPVKHQNLKKFKASRIRHRARVWMGFKKLPRLSDLTKVKKFRGKGKFAKYVTTKRAIKTGRESEEPVFKATMRSGHTGFFKRRTKRRLKIDELVVDISPAVSEIIPKVGRRVALVEFPKLFARELNRRSGRL